MGVRVPIRPEVWETVVTPLRPGHRQAALGGRGIEGEQQRFSSLESEELYRTYVLPQRAKDA